MGDKARNEKVTTGFISVQEWSLWSHLKSGDTEAGSGGLGQHYRFPSSRCFHSIRSLVGTVHSGPGCPPAASPENQTGHCYLEDECTALCHKEPPSQLDFHPLLTGTCESCTKQKPNTNRQRTNKLTGSEHLSFKLCIHHVKISLVKEPGLEQADGSQATTTVGDRGHRGEKR